MDLTLHLITFPEIRALFELHGDRQYSGEPVSQLEHALQCAHLAEQAGASDELITASLLHDLGHLSNDRGETPTLRGVDDKHQYHAASALRRIFPEAVRVPIALHVDAKRYLCTVTREYWNELSPDSKRSLELQGGPLSETDAANFVNHAYARDAIKLRGWDDQAKVRGAPTPALDHYLAIAQRCTL